MCLKKPFAVFIVRKLEVDQNFFNHNPNSQIFNLDKSAADSKASNCAHQNENDAGEMQQRQLDAESVSFKSVKEHAQKLNRLNTETELRVAPSENSSAAKQRKFSTSKELLNKVFFETFFFLPSSRQHLTFIHLLTCEACRKAHRSRKLRLF